MIDRLSIRQAEVSDTSSLVKLYNELASTDSTHVLDTRIKESKEDKRNFLLVAIYDGVVVGTLTLNIWKNAKLGERDYAIIENIIVTESKRGSGISKWLLNYAESVCKSFKCEKIILLSSSSQNNTHKIFRSFSISVTVSLKFGEYLADISNR